MSSSTKETTQNSAITLLQECLTNGNVGPKELYAWFLGERTIIQKTLLDAMFRVSSLEEIMTHINPKGFHGMDECQNSAYKNGAKDVYNALHEELKWLTSK